jgi:hypothetical protein
MRDHRRYAYSVWAASLLRADMIFGKDTLIDVWLGRGLRGNGVNMIMLLLNRANQLRQILLVREKEHVNQLAWKIYRRQSSEPSESAFLAGACDSYELRWWMDQFGKLARRHWRRELCARRQ